MKKFLALTSVLLITLSACAVNRVERVESSSDTFSLYKVPVVYGIGLAPNTPQIQSSNLTLIGFSEYDPDKKRGT